MSGLTKKAIRDSFIKLLNEKPLNQITIRDIVDDCRVNRNTFYYYFEDLPSLLESIVNEEFDRIIKEHPTVDSIEECLDVIIDFALKNRKAALNIYRSTNRDIYEQYQWRICHHIVTTYVDGNLAGRKVSPDDRKLIIDYMTCVLFGFNTAWLNNGMVDDLQSRFHRLYELKQGELEEMIARCEIK